MPTNDERREVAARLREAVEKPTITAMCRVARNFGIKCDNDSYRCDSCEKEVFTRLADLIEPEERTVNLTEAVDAICGEMCGDGWDWHNRAEAVVKTVAEMCGAKVMEE